MVGLSEAVKDMTELYVCEAENAAPGGFAWEVEVMPTKWQEAL